MVQVNNSGGPVPLRAHGAVQQQFAPKLPALWMWTIRARDIGREFGGYLSEHEYENQSPNQAIAILT